MIGRYFSFQHSDESDVRIPVSCEGGVGGIIGGSGHISITRRECSNIYFAVEGAIGTWNPSGGGSGVTGCNLCSHAEIASFRTFCIRRRSY